MWMSRRAVTLGLPWVFALSPSGPSSSDELLRISSQPFSRGSVLSPERNEDILVDWICRFTPIGFRSAVQEAGRFLYRGATEPILQQEQQAAQPGDFLQQPAPDLLLPETYYNDPMALAYFQCLEKRLNSQRSYISAKPSTGHIATSNPDEAGKWGPVVSVWPLGEHWSYVWPRDRETFYESVDQDATSKLCRTDQLMMDRGLVEALQKRREVLFATTGLLEPSTPKKFASTTLSRIPMKSSLSSLLVAAPSSFLAVSQDQDERLRNKLARRNYGLPPSSRTFSHY
jgi:hypothetical protein